MVPLVNKLAIGQQRNGNGRRPRQRRRRNRRAAARKVGLAPGQLSAPNTKIPAIIYSGMDDLPEASKGWIIKSLDPCGENRGKLDYGKIPDGAIPQSVCGELRQVLTVRKPGVSDMIVPLDGGMWALALLHMPMFRTPLIMVASTLRSEVQTTDLDAVLVNWNNLRDFAGARHPNWEFVGDGVYYSIVQWTALDGVRQPTSLGVSDTLSEYRITGDGMTIMHNTPSLINQGVIVTAQFNADNDHVTVEPDTDGRTISANVVLSRNLVSVGGQPYLRFDAVLPGTESADSVTHYSFDAAILDDPGPIGPAITATADFTPDAGPFGYSAGDILQFNKTTGPALPSTFSVTRKRGDATDILLTFVVSATTPAEAAVITGTSTALAHYGALCNALALPPVAQEDITQATPKTIQMLMKDFDGGYIVKRVFNPIYPMTKATTFGPVRFKTSNTTAAAFNAASGGLLDSFDAAYGISVTNISSLPNAAQPYLKLMRTYEAIPARGSPWGPFATSTPVKDDTAITIVRTIHDLDPFMYPAHYNGLGVLFGKIMAVMRKIPSWMRTGATVAQAVGKVVEDTTATIDNTAQAVKIQRAEARTLVVR
nr:hypothetical protein [Leuven Tetra-like virus 1]